MLAPIANPERLAEVGDWLVRCDTGAEFLAGSTNPEFARCFPQYRVLPIVPAFSSLSIPQDMVAYLTRRGIYAVAMGDESMHVLNLDAVRSRSAEPQRASAVSPTTDSAAASSSLSSSSRYSLIASATK